MPQPLLLEELEPEQDLDDESVPDPGSTAALVMSQFPAPVNGVHTQVDTHLIAHPPYQRSLSKTWADNQSAHGWNPALGYGVVVNKVALKSHMSRSNSEVDDEAVTYAEQTESQFVYEVIIGQHRSYMAKMLGEATIPALVLDDVDDDEAALLFVHDARTTRPLRGYDVHVAALTRNEPRAVAIQEALDARGVQLVPSGLTDGKVSCIRALEKICGTDVTVPDTVSLDWVLDTLMIAFPKAKWPDPVVHGLNLYRRAQVRDSLPLPTPKALGSLTAKPPRKNAPGGGFGGDPKLFADKVRDKARSTGSPSPHVAADVWDDLAYKLTSKASRYADLD